MNTLTGTQKAYIAGFVDGEGCISITRENKHNGNGHQAVFRVCDTHIGVLNYLCAITGLGYVKPWVGSSTERRAVRFKNCKPQWRWQFSSNGMRELLPEILPYLVVKREVAQVALELLQRNLTRGKSLTEEERVRRTPLYKRIKELNQRGT